MERPTHKLAFVDDHTLFRRGLINLVLHVRADVVVLFEADNGHAMQERIAAGQVPDIVLMDINMPDIDGYACVEWLRARHPGIHVLVLSMEVSEESILRMLRLGVKGYLGKDAEPMELSQAIESIAAGRYHYSELVTGRLVESIRRQGEAEALAGALRMTQPEQTFLRLACSEKTYDEIAAEMFVSPKTVDGYRNALFKKLGVKSRVGLAMYALKHGLVSG